MEDRRDPHRRAETVKRVVDWLRHQTCSTVDVPSEVAAPTAARRVLCYLGIRGLARWTGTGWMPRQALVTTLPVQVIEPDL
jgi:hypothetical protein